MISVACIKKKKKLGAITKIVPRATIVIIIPTSIMSAVKTKDSAPQRHKINKKKREV